MNRHRFHAFPILFSKTYSSVFQIRASPSKGEADAGVGIGIAWVGGIPVIGTKKILKVHLGAIPNPFHVCFGERFL